MTSAPVTLAETVGLCHDFPSGSGHIFLDRVTGRPCEHNAERAVHILMQIKTGIRRIDAKFCRLCPLPPMTGLRP